MKRGLVASVMGLRCPKCRHGVLFPTDTLAFDKPFDMLDNCPECNLNYMPEPGFYFGSMFISYIIWGFFSLSFCLSLMFIFDWSVNGSFVLLLFISAIFFVPLYRVSRSIWIHINIKYDEKALENK